MPNLVGIGNSQVPTNAMLGGLAYQDSVGEIDIDKIKTNISDNAVDVFVYDTRKDSDGGAWRHRTQNTSWYNEGVSATRGARKEFPTVAVVVATDGIYTIYDGDDPNLSMWMVFEHDASSGARIARQGTSGITMLNGLMCAVRSGSQRAAGFASFIDDTGYQINNIGKYLAIGGWDGLVNRNVTGSFTGTDSSYAVTGNGTMYDVTMTVLPNAPIDDATGLPIPTIAIATNGGISVITDSPTGVVYDLTTNNENSSVAEIAFLADNRYSFVTNSNNSRWTVDDIQTADENHNYFYQRTSYDYMSGGQGSINALGRNNGTCRGEYGEAIFRQASGMSRIRYRDTLINFTTTDFNTGWTAGEAKGIFLSSTDDTNLSGTSLIANGDFSSSSTAAFTTVAGGTATVVGGLLKLTDTGGAFCYASAPFTTVIGNQYYVTVDIVNNSNTAPSNYIRCGNSHNGTEFHDNNYGTSYGTKTFYFTATATTTYLTLISGHGAGNPFGHWDNVFVYKLDNNRINNSKGLQVYGAITKTAVATGAELVAYSGFSGSNFLQMPSGELGSNTSVNGPLTVSCWFKGSTNGSNSQTLIMIGPGSQHQARGLLLGGNGELAFFKWNNDPVSSTSVTDNQWHHCVATVDSSSTVKLYVDGNLVYNQTTTLVTSSSTVVRIGYSNGNNAPLVNGSLALCKISNDVADAEAIKKTYNDEKLLFRENAKCTLYGTSNSVTALAYDDTKNILHAGTSSGRSEFRGLIRINNTTTAVTTAISASDGLVAEQ